MTAQLSDDDQLSEDESADESANESPARSPSRKNATTKVNRSSVKKQKGPASSIAKKPRRVVQRPMIGEQSPIEEFDESDLTSSANSTGVDVTEALKRFMMQMEEKKKNDKAKSIQMGQKLREEAFQNAKGHMAEIVEVFNSDIAKYQQNTEKKIASKMKATQKEMNAFGADLQKTSKDLISVIKQIKHAQRQMEQHIDDFKGCANRIVDDFEAKLDAIVEEGHNKCEAEFHSPTSFTDIMDKLDVLVRDMESQLPADSSVL